jgi:primase-polymerase (primpol)-like protein
MKTQRSTIATPQRTAVKDPPLEAKTVRSSSRPPASHFDNIPLELKALTRWLVWRRSPRPNAGRFGKVPHSIADKKCNYTNPSEWLPFATAVQQYSRGNYDGIGLVLGEGLCGLDEDHCVRPDGSLTEDAARNIDLLNTYSEFSVSGDGVHSLAFGDLPKGPRKRGDHELYADNRFFVITGRKLPKSPGSVARRDTELLQLHSILFGDGECPNTPSEACPKSPGESALGVPKLAPNTQRERGREGVSDRLATALILQDKVAARYWKGCPEGVNPSDADFALMCKLAFYTRRNLEQMIDLFRQSEIGKRAKTNTLRGGVDYVRYTALRACKQQKAVWTPKSPISLKPSKQRPIGRPKCEVDPQRVRELRSAGKSFRSIAAELGIGRTTAARLYNAVSRAANVSQNSDVA